MSNLWLNLRVFYWHLQIGPDRPWVRVSFNRHHVGRRSPWVEFH